MSSKQGRGPSSLAHTLVWYPTVMVFHRCDEAAARHGVKLRPTQGRPRIRSSAMLYTRQRFGSRMSCSRNVLPPQPLSVEPKAYLMTPETRPRPVDTPTRKTAHVNACDEMRLPDSHDMSRTRKRRGRLDVAPVCSEMLSCQTRRRDSVPSRPGVVRNCLATPGKQRLPLSASCAMTGRRIQRPVS
jgi:hypothetical protein